MLIFFNNMSDSPTQPFISIIIPTRRELTVLRRCLDSLLNQNYPQDKFEIILAPEEKLEIEESARIKIIYQTSYANSRNLCAKAAKGEIFAFIDDDCLAPSDWLARGVKYFTDEKIGLIGGPVLPPEEESELTYRIGGYLLASLFVSGFASGRYRRLARPFPAKAYHLLTANNFISKKAFMAVAGFDERLFQSEETDLYFRLQEKGYQLLYIPETFVWHRARPVFLPLINKTFSYAAGRGILMAKKHNTIRLIYLIPTAIAAAAIVLMALSFVYKTFLFILLAISASYILAVIGNSAYLFLKREKQLLVFLYSLVETSLIHFTYAIGIPFGFLKYIINRQKKALRIDNKY